MRQNLRIVVIVLAVDAKGHWAWQRSNVSSGLGPVHGYRVDWYLLFSHSVVSDSL